MGFRRFIAALLLPWMLIGCAGFVPQVGPGSEPSGMRYQWLTTPVILVGDTQEHEATGYPLHDNDSAIDAYVEVAQRPPEQILFGRRLLEWALTHHPNEPFVHLGDVMDISCRSEGQRMARIFDAATSPGAILPGNHDGLMFGIYAYNLFDIHLDQGASRWNKACLRGVNSEDPRNKTANEALTKRGFIRYYIADQLRTAQHKSGLELPPETGRHRLSWKNPNPDAFLSAMEGELLDGFAYADSFLAQRLQLPAAPDATRRVVLIGLDTNQAGLLVSAWDTLKGNSPGSMGHIHPDQIAAVTHWVDDAVRSGDIVLFSGHHNWNSLGLPTRIMLRNLMSRLSHPLIYLSAHTHRGFWAEHRTLASRPVLELNVSSLSDWPIAYRRLRVGYDEAAQRLLVQGDLMPRGPSPNTSDQDLMKAWESQTCAASDVQMAQLQREDLGLVQQQKASRGGLVQWLLEGILPACETCEQPMYEHAHAYQNELLNILIQTDRDLGREALRLHQLPMPSWCGQGDFATCAAQLMATQPSDFKSHVNLFRRKATLVALLNEHLDDLNDPRSRAYMTCRAVLAARLDFNATDDDRNNHRSERKRVMEQFFRIEASVGME